MFYMWLHTTSISRIKSKLPEPTGTTVLHFALISFAISRFIPLSALRLWLPWRGCWHFVEGLNLTPSSARCLGHIVKSRPSKSPNKPTRARMSCFSDTTHVWDTFMSLRCSFMLSAHESRGISCCRPGQREEKSHSLPRYVANEQDSWAISTRTTQACGGNERFLDARKLIWRYFDVAIGLNHGNWIQSMRRENVIYRRISFWEARDVSMMFISQCHIRLSCHCLVLSGKECKCTI